MTRRFLLALGLVAASAAGSPADVEIVRIDPEVSPRFVRVSPDGAAVPEGTASGGNSSGFDVCLNNGGIFRANLTTGAYAACGTNGVFEQGVAEVTMQGGTATVKHVFASPAFQGLESLHASVNMTTGGGTAILNSRDEQHGTFPLVSISATVGSSDCSACPAQTAINEGVINSFPIPTKAIGFGSATGLSVLQQYSLNSDFDGRIRRLVAGISRQGSGPLSFELEVRSDQNGLPGDLLYTGPSLTFSDFPAWPAIGVVSQNVEIALNARIAAGLRFWSGVHYDPHTDPIYLPFGTNADSPISKIAYCSDGVCDLVTSNSQFTDARSLYLSADVQSNWLATGGAVVYGNQPMEILSEKCDGSYYRFDYDGSKLVQLYAENGPGASFAPTAYANAFARITPILSGQIRGIDGIAETRYNGTRYSAFSFTEGNSLEFCTRPRDSTDFVCHLVPEFPGGGSFTRIAGVRNGYELSFGNATEDRIYRWMITRGPTAWDTQLLVPLLGQIGNPEFGFPWYGVASSKLGVAYIYETSSALPQIQLANGNVFYGPFPLGTDVLPAGFNPNLASRMAADCTRNGLCVFGRFQTVSGKNLLDRVDFRGSAADPDIATWELGSGLSGLRFGRAVSFREKDGTALYASYTPSTTPNQYRLQLDGINLAKYTKFTVAYDFGAGAGNYPLSLSRADGEWGLAHKFGIDLLYKWDVGCEPAGRLRGRGSATGETGGTRAPFPCEIPIVGKF